MTIIRGSVCRWALAFFSLIWLGGCSETRKPTPPGGDVGEKTVSYGEEIKIEDYLVSGKTVIFDFFSEYCPPCQRLSPLLSKLAEKRKDLVLVKVDINRPGKSSIDWDSPVARQYGLHGIPHVKIYSPEGKLEAEGDEAMGKIQEMFAKEGIE